MSQKTPSAGLCVSPSQIWTRLAADLRDRAMRLMAQLAFNLVVAQSEWLGKEYTRDRQSCQQKDPP
jgi:hypothetical protein